MLSQKNQTNQTNLSCLKLPLDSVLAVVRGLPAVIDLGKRGMAQEDSVIV